MIKSLASFLNEKSTLLLGVSFLVLYWSFGYDGITFSDEVTYLQLGHQLWNHEAVVSDYHFTSRWGAFLFSGFFTQLLGFSDRYGSLATLGFYLLALLVVWKVTPVPFRKWSVPFFLGHIYLLHFLTKVYPDGFLLLWVVLIPAVAVFREKYPFSAAGIMSMAFFIGFCTKETIIFLLPFPPLLLYFDLKRKQSLSFHYYFLGISLFILVLYLGYYQWQFGDWLHRFKNINDGHYISEYTYHDKGIGSIIKRISYLPLLTFVERTYWLWVVMAIPGVYHGIKHKERIYFEFGLGVICLVVSFWLMTSTLEFYNPIYLNPRHLIILIAPLAICIALGSNQWLHSRRWKVFLAGLLTLGGGYSIMFGDWKIGLFYLLFAGLLFLWQEKAKLIGMVIFLAFPVIFSVYYQHQLKNYPHFLEVFRYQADLASEASPLLTHEFVVHSKDVLLEKPQVQAPLVSLLDIDSLIKNPPKNFTLLVYQYYCHAYPAEEEYLDNVEEWIKKNYRITGSKEDQWVSIRSLERLALP